MNSQPPDAPRDPGPCPVRLPSEHVVAITVRMSIAQRDWVLNMAGYNGMSMNKYALHRLGVEPLPQPDGTHDAAG